MKGKKKRLLAGTLALLLSCSTLLNTGITALASEQSEEHAQIQEVKQEEAASETLPELEEVKEQLTEEERIRFIDSHYHTLFSIADGDSIEIVYPDGKREERVCTYIDEYHTQVGARVFHICEFAEIMEANGKSYCPAECKEKEERKEAVKGEKKTGTTRMERSRR